MLAILGPLVLMLAPVQGGYTTEEFPEHGLTLPRPRDFVLAPQPLDTRFRVVYFEERQSVAEREGHAKPPVCFVVRIDGDREHALAATDGGEPIVDFDGYLAEYHAGYERSAPRGQRERDGYAATEYDLVPDGDSALAVWCCVYERSQPTQRTFALIGACARADLEVLLPIWREVAGKMRFAEPVPPDHSGLERLYAKKPWVGTEQRVDLRKRLLRGWEAEDTEHFIVAVHEPRKPYLKRVLGDLEALRAGFDATFGLGDEAPLGVVRLCASRDEYLVFGGDPNNSSRWNADIGELVLFDPVQEGERGAEELALGRMHGAAFLQYAQPRLMGLAHPWFTMGHYDLYSAAQVSGKSVKLRPSRTLAWVQKRIEKGEQLPLAELLALEDRSFNESNAFAQSGSFVHFLRDSKEARADASWSGLLERYQSALLATDAARRAAGDDEEVARKTARQAALDAALEGVDVAALDAAWAAATLRLKAD